MKLGIVVGHNRQAQGANAVEPINASEFEFNSELAEIMDDMALNYGIDAKIFKRRAQGSFRREILEVYSKTDKWGAEVTIELHFNAFNSRASGTETLAGPSGKSLRIASEVQRQVVDLYDRSATTDRGVKPYRPGIRGGLSLITGKAPAILVEPFFGDNRKEVEMVTRIGEEALAKAYLLGISSALGLSIESPGNDDQDEDLPIGEAANGTHWG